MVNSGTPDEIQQAMSSRQHSRVQSSGNQTSASAQSSTPPTIASNSIPTASTTALPRMSPNTAGIPTAVSSIRNQSSSSTPRAENSSPTSAQISSSSTARSAVPTSSTSALPVRRETLTGHSSSTSFGTASSYLSSPSTAPPSGSLFGYLGGQRASSSDHSSTSHPHGWRAMSAASNSTPTNGTNAVNSSSTSSTNTSNIANVYQSSQPSTVASSNFQSRPAITSFLASTSSGSIPWNNQSNYRGATQALQHHNQSNQTGSPIRNHAIVSGISSPWLGLSNQQGIHGGSHGTAGTGSNAGWTVTDSIAARGGWASPGRLMGGFEENQIVSFTWLIPEAHLLRDEVETSPLPSEGGRSISAGAGKSEVWTTQPIFGDGKWKLELVRTSRPKEEEVDDSNGDEIHQTGGPEMEEGKEKVMDKMTVLSIYLTSMVLDYSAADLEIPASIMIGIKAVQSQAKASRSGSWIWQEFTHYTFRRENEFYECHTLPTLSSLLQDGEIDRQDAFSLTIQISTGPSAAIKTSVDEGVGISSEMRKASPFIVQDNQLVHYSLINGLERLLDSRSTGDVVLIVRERGVVRKQSKGNVKEEGNTFSDEIWTRPVGTPMFAWGQSQECPQVVVRDRLLWAHSSILGARSEFFHDMLQSQFAEGQEQNLSTGGEVAQGETIQIQGRKVKTLRINDADFTTVYWLLRFLYLEEVEFLSTEDVRCAALDDDWMTMGQISSTEQDNRMAVWQWTSLEQLDANATESYQEQGIQATPAAAALYPSSIHQKSNSRHRPGSSSVPISPDISNRLHHGPASPNRSMSNLSHDGYSSYQRRVGSDRDAARQSGQNLTTQEASLPDSPCPTVVANSYDSSSSNLYQSLFMDPHLHPCEKPPPTSSLALYRLAHRYHQQDLVHLAKAQLISSLTPQTAFPTLLATNLYSDLYENVKGYVLDNWEIVSQTSEFERCCDEVSAGEVSFLLLSSKLDSHSMLTTIFLFLLFFFTLNQVGCRSWSRTSTIYAIPLKPHPSEMNKRGILVLPSTCNLCR